MRQLGFDNQIVWEALKGKTILELSSGGSKRVNHAEIPQEEACFQL